MIRRMKKVARKVPILPGLTIQRKTTTVIVTVPMTTVMAMMIMVCQTFKYEAQWPLIS